MAETDLHLEEMVEAIAILKHRFREDPTVYVAGNLLIYYEEGDTTARFAPDVFVVRGVPKRRRRIYKLWEEKEVPAFVLEVTSRGTRLQDKGSKRELCAELGVREYFLFDPEADYLKPPLQGFRLRAGDYEPIEPDAAGQLTSEELGLLLTREAEGLLRFIDPASGEPLLRIEEHAVRGEREAARADAAEAEIARLRALLEKR
jgi:Uma2 family endonuclease